jgi:threonyl-tRNA synthetase
VSPAEDSAARDVVELLLGKGLRAGRRCDGSLGSRVRDARHRRDALVAVIGPREAADGTVQVTDVACNHRETMAVDRLVERAGDAYRRRLPVVDWAG